MALLPHSYRVTDVFLHAVRSAVVHKLPKILEASMLGATFLRGYKALPELTFRE